MLNSEIKKLYLSEEKIQLLIRFLIKHEIFSLNINPIEAKELLNHYYFQALNQQISAEKIKSCVIHLILGYVEGYYSPDIDNDDHISPFIIPRWGFVEKMLSGKEEETKILTWSGMRKGTKYSYSYLDINSVGNERQALKYMKSILKILISLETEKDSLSDGVPQTVFGLDWLLTRISLHLRNKYDKTLSLGQAKALIKKHIGLILDSTERSQLHEFRKKVQKYSLLVNNFSEYEYLLDYNRIKSVTEFKLNKKVNFENLRAISKEFKEINKVSNLRKGVLDSQGLVLNPHQLKKPIDINNNSKRVEITAKLYCSVCNYQENISNEFIDNENPMKLPKHCDKIMQPFITLKKEENGLKKPTIISKPLAVQESKDHLPKAVLKCLKCGTSQELPDTLIESKNALPLPVHCNQPMNICLETKKE